MTLPPRRAVLSATLLVLAGLGVLTPACPAAAPPPATRPASAGRFTYAGQVLDAGGRPVSGVDVVATHRLLDGGVAYIDAVRTDADGRFSIDRARAMSGVTPGGFADVPVRLTFTHAGHLSARLQDVGVLPNEVVTRLLVRLRDGRSVRGRVTDADWRPVGGALVAAVPEKALPDDAAEYRRGTLTAADGTYALHGLPGEDLALRVLAAAPGRAFQSAEQTLTGTGDTTLDVHTAAVVPLADEPTHTLLGMTLLDVNPRLAAALHLPRLNGVLVLDPGPQPLHFELGAPQAGDAFWIVGDRPVKDFAALQKRVLDEHAKPTGDADGVRVVYDCARPEMQGTMTTYWTLSPDEIKAVAAAK